MLDKMRKYIVSVTSFWFVLFSEVWEAALHSGCKALPKALYLAVGTAASVGSPGMGKVCHPQQCHLLVPCWMKHRF